MNANVMQTSEIMHTLVGWVTVTVGMINEQLTLTSPISFDDEAFFETRIKFWLNFLSVFHSHIYINLKLIRCTWCWFSQDLAPALHD